MRYCRSLRNCGSWSLRRSEALNEYEGGQMEWIILCRWKMGLYSVVRDARCSVIVLTFGTLYSVIPPPHLICVKINRWTNNCKIQSWWFSFHRLFLANFVLIFKQVVLRSVDLAVHSSNVGTPIRCQTNFILRLFNTNNNEKKQNHHVDVFNAISRIKQIVM